MRSLYAIEWEESEAGWGIRPDGFSFHRTEEEREQFINDYYAKLPKKVPHCYSRVSERLILEVSEELYDHVITNGSIWCWQRDKNFYKTYTFRENK